MPICWFSGPFPRYMVLLLLLHDGDGQIKPDNGSSYPMDLVLHDCCKSCMNFPISQALADSSQPPSGSDPFIIEPSPKWGDGQGVSPARVAVTSGNGPRRCSEVTTQVGRHCAPGDSAEPTVQRENTLERVTAKHLGFEKGQMTAPSKWVANLHAVCCALSSYSIPEKKPHSERQGSC